MVKIIIKHRPRNYLKINQLNNPIEINDLNCLFISLLNFLSVATFITHHAIYKFRLFAKSFLVSVYN